MLIIHAHVASSTPSTPLLNDRLHEPRSHMPIIEGADVGGLPHEQIYLPPTHNKYDTLALDLGCHPDLTPLDVSLHVTCPDLPYSPWEEVRAMIGCFCSLVTHICHHLHAAV